MTAINLMGIRIRQCREDMDLTQEELGQKLGLQRAVINKYEKGRIENMKRATIKQMADIFKVSPSWLMGLDEESNTTLTSKAIPLLGTIAAGVPILAEENIEEYFNIDNRLKADFALRIRGDSMKNVNIVDGDIVFIRKQNTLENGEIGAILVDENATLKRFYHTDGQVILQAENPEYKPMVVESRDVRILGKIVANLREFK